MRVGERERRSVVATVIRQSQRADSMRRTSRAEVLRAPVASARSSRTVRTVPTAHTVRAVRAVPMCAALIVGLLLGTAAPAGALPPPPENPSDQEIADSQVQADQINATIGELSATVAATEAQIEQLQTDMELKTELAQKAAVDRDVANADAADAATAAQDAANAASAAQAPIDDAEVKAADFAAASFRQGSQLGSMSALLDAGSVDELLQRKQLLDAISGSQLNVIGNLQRAQVDKANLDAAARQALLDAQGKQAAADAAKAAADQAATDAQTALDVGQSQLTDLQGQLGDQQIQYQAAVNTIDQLQGQRQAYNDWLVLKAAEEERLRKEAEEAARKAAEEAARKAAEEEAARKAAEEEAARKAAEEEAARQAAAQAAAEQAAQQAAAEAAEAAAQAAAQAAADKAAKDAEVAAARSAQAASAAAAAAASAAVSSSSGSGSSSGSSSAGGSSASSTVRAASYNGSIGEAIVEAAKSQLGVPYAWGGGTSSGPSRGIRDGGVADRYGDYNKIGFDCSGLALYAYAQVGVTLPHYSGSQYSSGPHIAKNNLQPGDLVFWAYNTSDPGTIHHVAIWVGDGTIVEAPNSGSYVKISNMKWSGYIGASRPYA